MNNLFQTLKLIRDAKRVTAQAEKLAEGEPFEFHSSYHIGGKALNLDVAASVSGEAHYEPLSLHTLETEVLDAAITACYGGDSAELSASVPVLDHQVNFDLKFTLA